MATPHSQHGSRLSVPTPIWGWNFTVSWLSLARELSPQLVNVNSAAA